MHKWQTDMHMSFAHAQMQRLFSLLSREVPLQFHSFDQSIWFLTCMKQGPPPAGQLGSHSVTENTTACKRGDSYLLIQTMLLCSHLDYIYREMFCFSAYHEWTN